MTNEARDRLLIYSGAFRSARNCPYDSDWAHGVALALAAAARVTPIFWIIDRLLEAYPSHPSTEVRQTARSKVTFYFIEHVLLYKNGLELANEILCVPKLMKDFDHLHARFCVAEHTGNPKDWGRVRKAYARLGKIAPRQAIVFAWSLVERNGNDITDLHRIVGYAELLGYTIDAAEALTMTAKETKSPGDVLRALEAIQNIQQNDEPDAYLELLFDQVGPLVIEEMAGWLLTSSSLSPFIRLRLLEIVPIEHLLSN